MQIWHVKRFLIENDGKPMDKSRYWGLNVGAVVYCHCICDRPAGKILVVMLDHIQVDQHLTCWHEDDLRAQTMMSRRPRQDDVNMSSKECIVHLTWDSCWIFMHTNV